MKRFKYQKDALLEVLNTTQETFGYLSEDLLIYVATYFHSPLVRVYGMGTFYHMFTFTLLGAHNAIVCTGTASQPGAVGDKRIKSHGFIHLRAGGR